MVLLGVAGALGGLFLLAFLAQRRLIYFPERQDPKQAERQARQLGLEPWREGGRLLGWRAPLPVRRAAGAVLVLHGNAGAAIHRTYFRDLFQDPALGEAMEVYLLEYPGYGPRPGAPSERTLRQAAGEAIDLLRRDARGPLLLVGESLGGAVAALAAAERPGEVQGLLLVTPLPSLPAVARRHYPFLPGWLLRDTWRADEALKRFPGPVAFLLAGRDSVVPPELGRALFERCPGPKRLWVDEVAGHNTLDYDARHPPWRQVLEFLLRPPPGR
jgi:uncharacterized protein